MIGCGEDGDLRRGVNKGHVGQFGLDACVIVVLPLPAHEGSEDA